jgi:hypothetical protein
MFRELHGHLFPGDHDEHGAVIAAGICESGRGTRYLARKLFIARDGVDYVPGEHGYRALSANFVAQVSNYCALNKLCYFAIHCHGGHDSVGFSNVDLESHKRGYPALTTPSKPFRASGSITGRTRIFALRSLTWAIRAKARKRCCNFYERSTNDSIDANFGG